MFMKSIKAFITLATQVSKAHNCKSSSPQKRCRAKIEKLTLSTKNIIFIDKV